jgi:hypothetical protein
MAKTEVVLSHCIWLASTNVVSMYEVGYSWVLTLVCIHSISRSRSLATILFERVQIWFYFSLFIHSIWLLIGFLSPLFEQLDWTSWDFEHVYAAVMGASDAGPSFQCCVGPASQVLLLLYGCRKSLFFRQVGSLAWTLLSENKKNIHELFEASFEESSLADYTLDEGCWDVLVLNSSSSLIWHPTLLDWTFVEEASIIYPQCLHTLIPKV